MVEDGDIDLEEDIFNLDLERGAVGGTGLEAILGKPLDCSQLTLKSIDYSMLRSQ